MDKYHSAKGSQLPKFPEDGKLRLYSMRFCPYAQRVHLVLEAKNIPYNTAYINLTDKPEWLIQKSPLGKVPALEIPSIRGDPLIESLVIADYLDEQYPFNPLNSRDPVQKARDRIMVERFNAVISPFYRLFFSESGAQGAPGSLTEFVNGLDIFEAELRKRGSKFYGGATPGMLDYMIWPWCERTDMMIFVIGDKYELDKERFAKLLGWKDSMKQDNAVKAILISGEDHYTFRQSRFSGAPNYDLLANPAKKSRLS
nr:glutathione S transferase [Diamesa zernyi]